MTNLNEDALRALCESLKRDIERIDLQARNQPLQEALQKQFARTADVAVHDVLKEPTKQIAQAVERLEAGIPRIQSKIEETDALLQQNLKALRRRTRALELWLEAIP